jgi:hypothetical protein
MFSLIVQQMYNRKVQLHFECSATQKLLPHRTEVFVLFFKSADTFYQELASTTL